MQWVIHAVLLINVLGALPVSGFKGAVFEHARISTVGHNQPKEVVQANLEYYKIAAKVARSNGAEVIVFPEYGLFPVIDNRERLRKFLEYVPNPKFTQSNPCEEEEAYADRPILLTLSCLAREYKMYIVVNMGDIQPCEEQKDCPKDGAFHYNTNVVFERNGAILAKYHKEHLFGEDGMNVPPLGKQDPTFKTDLGRFATCVCFDIIFHRIVEVSHWKDVEAVLFPTMWIDNSPLYSAMEYFQAWSIGNNVTLLAANIHHPGTASIGSGIVKGYSGSLVYTFNPDGQSKLLIADVKHTKQDPSIYIITKNGTEKWTDDGKNVQSLCSIKVLGPTKDIYKDYRCLERDLSNFTLVKLTKSKDNIHACNNELCCTLEYSAQDMEENYVLGVNNGSFNAINRYTWHEEVCFLARCDGKGDKPCVTFPTQSKTRFHYVSLKANFSTNSVYPTVMTSKMRLPPRNEWEFDNQKQTFRVSFKDGSGKNILVVGLKGRPYDRDPPYKQRCISDVISTDATCQVADVHGKESFR